MLVLLAKVTGTVQSWKILHVTANTTRLLDNLQMMFQSIVLILELSSD